MRTQEIAEHYDPDGLTQPWEAPADVLAIFQASFPECDLTLNDVREYIESLKPQYYS